MNHSKPWYYIPLALVATTLWGSAFAGAKIGFQYMPPLMLSAVRFTLASFLLLPVISIMRVSWSRELKHWRFMLLFGFIQTFLQYGLFYFGLDLIPSAIAAIIIGAGPMFIAIMAHYTLKNDKFTTRKIIAIILGLSGVIYISLSGDNSGGTLISPHFLKGVVLLIASNLVGSYTNIMVVRHKEGVSPVMLTMVANFTGGVMLLFASLFVEDSSLLFQDFPLEFYIAILWLAIIPAAGFSIWYYLLSLEGVKVSELNIWKFTIPIVGVVLSWLLLPDESPNFHTITGIVIISSSVLILQMPKNVFKRR